MGYIATMEHRISEHSRQTYTDRLADIGKRLTTSEHLTADVLVNEIARMAEQRDIAYATFRIRKSAVMYWLGQQAQAVIANGQDPATYAEAYERLRHLKYGRTGDALPQRNGAARKLKFFPKECLDALAAFAAERGHQAPNATRALAFARANLLVGLRPIEWFDVSFASMFKRSEDGQLLRDESGRLCFEHALIVGNAKATHGRGNGAYRELILHDISKDELKALMSFAEFVKEFEAMQPSQTSTTKLSKTLFKPINTAMRNALKRKGFAATDIPAPYSTRHQVVADFKASGVSKREIAAFFGHSSDYTHQAHYGPRRHGSGKVTFRASPESVSRVGVQGPSRRWDSVQPELAAEVERWSAERGARA